MPSLADAIVVLYPDARPLVNYEVTAAGDAQEITRWDDSLGPRPTAEQIASVTDDQAAAARLAKVRAAALAGLLARADETAIAVRLMLRAVVDLINNRLDGTAAGRVTEGEILAYIQTNPGLGDPGPRA